jgi:hypothetical protein
VRDDAFWIAVEARNAAAMRAGVSGLFCFVLGVFQHPPRHWARIPTKLTNWKRAKPDSEKPPEIPAGFIPVDQDRRAHGNVVYADIKVRYELDEISPSIENDF